MPRVALVSFLALVLAACQQAEPVAAPAPPPADPQALTAAEKQAITDEILRNWDLEPLKGCPWGEMPPIRLEIDLGNNGAVTAVQSLGEVAQDSCTQLAHNSAQQAVRVSSPLPVPPGKNVPLLRLKLTPLHVAW